MLPRAEILAWRSVAPWDDEGDIEQDLIITRALFDIFHDEWLNERIRSMLGRMDTARATSE
jgi:hypothetical protein